MNTAIPSVVLLVCIAVCASEGQNVNVMATPRCLCTDVCGPLAKSTIIKISTAKEFPVRPYCNHVEVIAYLKDGTRLCLNPDDQMTKAILKSVKRKRNK